MAKQISCGYCIGWSQCATCAARQNEAEAAEAAAEAAKQQRRDAAAQCAENVLPAVASAIEAGSKLPRTSGNNYVACAKCTGAVGDDGRCQDCGWQPQSDE